MSRETQRDNSAVGDAADLVTTAAQTLQGATDAARGSDEEDLVDIGVVDTHFEGRGADDGTHLAGGEAGFDGFPFGPFDGGVVDGDVGFVVGQQER